MLDHEPAGVGSPARSRRLYHIAFWGVATAAALGLLYLLRSVLAPFVAGMIIAYLLDPIADRLEKWGFSRLWATIVITLGFVVLLVAGLLILIPVLQNQISQFAQNAPGYARALLNRGHDLMELLDERLSPDDMQRIYAFVEGWVANVTTWILGVIKNVLSGGMVLVGVIAVLVVVPVITFYMLRDWDKMVSVIDRFLPRPYAPVIRQQFGLINQTIAGFIRGQFLVCLILGSFYGVSLSLVGLDLAVVVGLTSGMLSFIPYVGTITGFVMSMGLAFAQFSDWVPIAMVFGVFVFGQIVESNYLTPKLVGDRVGLHAVWVIFALLAGGGLFGFVGVLLAVPVAAAIGVLVRFFLAQYVASPLYTGVDPDTRKVTPTVVPDSKETLKDLLDDAEEQRLAELAKQAPGEATMAAPSRPSGT